MLLFNAGSEPVTFSMPNGNPTASWECLVDTATGVHSKVPLGHATRYEVGAHAMAVLRLARGFVLPG